MRFLRTLTNWVRSAWGNVLWKMFGNCWMNIAQGFFHLQALSRLFEADYNGEDRICYKLFKELICITAWRLIRCAPTSTFAASPNLKSLTRPWSHFQQKLLRPLIIVINIKQSSFVLNQSQKFIDGNSSKWRFLSKRFNLYERLNDFIRISRHGEAKWARVQFQPRKSVSFRLQFGRLFCRQVSRKSFATVKKLKKNILLCSYNFCQTINYIFKNKFTN